MKYIMKYKVGDKLKVWSKLYGHDFSIGETVTVVAVDNICGDYRCENDTEKWYLREDEVKLFKK